MKRTTLMALILSIGFAAIAIPPYYLVKEFSGNLATTENQVTEALADGGFRIIGSYHPGDYDNYKVIVYTSDALVSLCSGVKDRGMLAAALKVGIRDRDGQVQVTMMNPKYLFFAYLRDAMDNEKIKKKALDIDEQAKASMRKFGSDFTAFGGDLNAKDLKKYKYMAGMPKFDDPVLLKQFASHQEALNTINKNLNARKNGTVKVFELSSPDENVTVFGIGLLSKDKGEDHFLSIIGKKHMAAMPYEIIVENGKATMLHGRFRFASHWPELTMRTFTKIMSSPGDVEGFLKALTE